MQNRREFAKAALIGAVSLACGGIADAKPSGDFASYANRLVLAFSDGATVLLDPERFRIVDCCNAVFLNRRDGDRYRALLLLNKDNGEKASYSQVRDFIV